MKLLVIDDHPLVTEALRHVASRLGPGTEVLSAPQCAAGFAIADAAPDLELILLDLNLPGLSGVAAIEACRARFPSVPVVVLSAEEGRSPVLASIHAGAAGFIPKSSPGDVMLSALRLVLSGGKYVPEQALGSTGDAKKARIRREPIERLGLTPRQVEVLRLLARGRSNKVIGRELGLAERTVKAHVTAVLRALKVATRTEAALAATRLGLGSGSGTG